MIYRFPNDLLIINHSTCETNNNIKENFTWLSSLNIYSLDVNRQKSYYISKILLKFITFHTKSNAFTSLTTGNGCITNSITFRKWNSVRLYCPKFSTVQKIQVSTNRVDSLISSEKILNNTGYKVKFKNIIFNYKIKI